MNTAVNSARVAGGLKEATLIHQILTGLVLVPAILLFLAHGFVIKLLVRDAKVRRERLVKNVSAYSRFALRVLRIDVIANDPSKFFDDKENALIVCNHMSYLDLLIIASVRPAVFVTSIDMGEVFFLGTMAEIGGSLFIERRHRERVGFDVEQMANVLREGQDVILFPEGTSSNGETVLPFKKSLLMAAPVAQKKILPLTLRYSEIDGERFGPRNHTAVCWYGKMSFLPHFLQLLGHEKIVAELEFHKPITPRESDDKEILAKWTYRLISGAYASRTRSESSKQEPDERFASI